MKKRYGFAIAALALSLNGCYVVQNFDNQLQVSRTGQYQLDVDTDVVSIILLQEQYMSANKKQPISPKNLASIYANCEKQFNYVVAKDAEKGKHIVSSKYLGECRGHVTLKYTGNIIKEKSFEAPIGSQEAFFGIPIQIKYDAKTKQIAIKSQTHGDKQGLTIANSLNFKYNGKFSVKTDAKVVSNNADSKPYWGLIGAYKWDVVDMTTPNQLMVIKTTGI